HKSGEVVEGKLGPLIETAFERQQTVEEDHNAGEWQIKGEDRQDPVNVLLVAQFGSVAHPDCAHDKDNLSENQVEESQLFFENSTALLDLTLEVSNVGGWSI